MTTVAEGDPAGTGLSADPGNAVYPRRSELRRAAARRPPGPRPAGRGGKHRRPAPGFPGTQPFGFGPGRSSGSVWSFGPVVEPVPQPPCPPSAPLPEGEYWRRHRQPAAPVLPGRRVARTLLLGLIVGAQGAAASVLAHPGGTPDGSGLVLAVPEVRAAELDPATVERQRRDAERRERTAAVHQAVRDASPAKAKAALAQARAAAARIRVARERMRNARRDPRSAARIMLADRGWPASQFTCLDSLWTRESNWDYRASNPSSGAYGIPQSLPGHKMGSVAEDWRTNPVTQIRWGLDYIAERYGSPCGAWSYSQAHHSY